MPLLILIFQPTTALLERITKDGASQSGTGPVEASTAFHSEQSAEVELQAIVMR